MVDPSSALYSPRFTNHPRRDPPKSAPMAKLGGQGDRARVRLEPGKTPEPIPVNSLGRQPDRAGPSNIRPPFKPTGRRPAGEPLLRQITVDVRGEILELKDPKTHQHDDGSYQLKPLLPRFSAMRPPKFATEGQLSAARPR